MGFCETYYPMHFLLFYIILTLLGWLFTTLNGIHKIWLVNHFTLFPNFFLLGDFHSRTFWLKKTVGQIIHQKVLCFLNNFLTFCIHHLLQKWWFFGRVSRCIWGTNFGFISRLLSRATFSDSFRGTKHCCTQYWNFVFLDTNLTNWISPLRILGIFSLPKFWKRL